MSRSSIDGQHTSSLHQRRSDQGLLIAIDGPAGVGKSTVARRLAQRLQYRYLDTGALYRAVAWQVHQSGVEPSDIPAIGGLLDKMIITADPSAVHPRVEVNGRDVTAEIRSPEVSRMASIVSAVPLVRQWLLPVQRAFAPGGALVAEGRDVGTKVFPQADLKFFLEADPQIRAARRHQEMAAGGEHGSLARTAEDMQARDARDRSREVAPLVPAPDARVIDTTALDIEQVVEQMMSVVTTRL